MHASIERGMMGSYGLRSPWKQWQFVRTMRRKWMGEGGRCIRLAGVCKRHKEVRAVQKCCQSSKRNCNRLLSTVRALWNEVVGLTFSCKCGQFLGSAALAILSESVVYFYWIAEYTFEWIFCSTNLYSYPQQHLDSSSEDKNKFSNERILGTRLSHLAILSRRSDTRESLRDGEMSRFFP